MSKLVNRLLFRKGDPMRDLHVPRRKRLSEDGGPASDASDDTTQIDKDAVRQETTVVPESKLQ